MKTLTKKKKKRKTENLAGVHSFSSNDDRTALISTPLSYLMKLWVQLKKLWRNILSPWLKKKVTDHKGYPFFLILMKLASTGSKCSQVCTLSQGLRLQGSTDCSWRFNWLLFLLQLLVILVLYLLALVLNSSPNSIFFHKPSYFSCTILKNM